MGGHGGLNILPQKRWNVYNFDNREKVRQDEEAAAKEEQLKREQSRKRDTEFRLEQLRQARGLASSSKSGQSANAVSAPGADPESKSEPEPKSKHINLFEGIRIFDPVGIEAEGDEKRKGFKRMKKEAPSPKIVLPEDEKYRLGYGVAGKGVKLPWYMEKRSEDANEENGGESDEEKSGVGSKRSGKKTLEELREERLKRESREKERERALVEKGRRQVCGMKDRGYHRRGDRFN